MWGPNSPPRDQESHAPVTEPAGCSWRRDILKGDITNTKYSYLHALKHYTEVKTEIMKIIKSIVVDRTVFLRNSCVEALTPITLTLSKVIKANEVIRVGPWSETIIALLPWEDMPESLVSLSPPCGKHSVKAASQAGGSQQTPLCQPWTLGFRPPELREHKCLYVSCSVCSVVMLAWAG